MTYIIHLIHLSNPTVNDRQSPAVQLGKDFQKKSGLQRSNGHKLWWLVDMMSARSVFHSKVWRFNFSANQTAVLPGLAILPLTVVLLQTGISSFHYILFPLHFLSITSSFHFSSFYLFGKWTRWRSDFMDSFSTSVYRELTWISDCTFYFIL